MIYAVFLALNIVGVELSFRVTLVVTLAALAVLVIFWISAIPQHRLQPLGAEHRRPTAASSCRKGTAHGSRSAFTGVLATLPFAVWLFLAIEQLPLAAEESVDPQARHAEGHPARHVDADRFGLHDRLLNPSVIGVGSFALGKSGEPLLDGFRAIYGGSAAKMLAFVAVVGLIASFHTIIYAKGRQIYSLSRAGYFPTGLSVTHGDPQDAARGDDRRRARRRSPSCSSSGSASARSRAAAIIGGTLLNMAVFGAMFSYILQAVSFILLRQNQPNIERPYRSPLGIPGAVATIVIGW